MKRNLILFTMAIVLAAFATAAVASVRLLPSGLVMTLAQQPVPEEEKKTPPVEMLDLAGDEELEIPDDPLALDEEEAAIPNDPLAEEEEEEEPLAPAEGEQEEQAAPEPQPQPEPQPRPNGGRPLDVPAGQAAPAQDAPDDQFYDVLVWRKTLRSDPESFNIVPLREFIGRSVVGRGRIRFQRYTHTGQLFHELSHWQVDHIYYYEDRMGDRAAEEVGLQSLEQMAQVGRVLDFSDEKVAEGAPQAERILQRAIAQHDFAVERRRRTGAAARKELRDPLVRALVNLRLGRVDQFIRQARYQQAEAECDRLGAEVRQGHPQFVDLRSRLEKIFLVPAEAARARGDYAVARDLLQRLFDRLGDARGGRAEQFQQELLAEALRLVEEARTLRTSDPAGAVARLDRAAAIWSPLPGLEELRGQIDHRTLHCAYTELPRQLDGRFLLTPWKPRSPVERHAVSLVFESLVRWVDDPEAGAHYEPQLAEGRPVPLARGRIFRLPRCLWSDSREQEPYYCLRDDVRRTLKLLRDPRISGYSPAWSSLLVGVENPEPADAPTDQAALTLVRLARDHWQPLSLVDFKVLPGHCLPVPLSEEDWEKKSESERQRLQGELQSELLRFAAEPVGTGPYGIANEGHDADTMRLVANPNYRKPGLPRIREVVFHRMDSLSAVDQFQEGKIQLIYDVRREHVNQLPRSQVHALRTPSVWFLAPNYRRGPLQSRNLRLAIAHAIDRDAILDACFPTVAGGDDRAALSGPYPRDSWAYNPAVRDYTTAEAAGYAAAARREFDSGVPFTLTLVYPAGAAENQAIETACRQIQQQVKAHAGIEIQLEGVPSSEFYDRVVNRHDFDLAYWRHDFGDATYWLEPLLDGSQPARRPGGPNLLGYTPDADMARFFREIRLHKCFRTIQDVTHQIHEHVHHEAIVIPLWQLDTYVALADSVRNAKLDPFVLFGDVEHWGMGAGGR